MWTANPAPYTLPPDRLRQSTKVSDESRLQSLEHPLTSPVYVYRVEIDSVGGVSSTRSTALATLGLQNGEVRQLQFVNDDTLMILWRNDSKSRIHRYLKCKQANNSKQKASHTSLISPSNPSLQTMTT